MKKHLFTFCTALLGLFANKAISQTISTIAGTGLPAFGGDGGSALAAYINQPAWITTDGSGNYYIADRSNNRVRKVNASGIITTIAGTGAAGYGGDGGPATAAALNGPTSVTLDAAGNIYIGDLYNHRVRKINTAGIISTYAGTGVAGHTGDGGPATAAKFDHPYGIQFNSAGEMLITDEYNQCFRKINAAGIVTNFAGNGSAGYSGDGGPASSASMYMPHYFIIDASDNIYFTDNSNHRIRKITSSGIISTIAGTGTVGFSGDGGPATAAQVNWCSALALDGAGNLYLADQASNRVRKITPAGIISTFAGIGTATFSGDGGPAIAAGINNPAGLAFDAMGNMLIADWGDNRIRKISPNNHIPNFIAGAEGSLLICVNEVPVSTDALLAVSDLDMGQTLTWSVVTPPLHGILSASYTTASTGGVVTPTGTSYMASSGYSGTDVFKVQVFDGIAYDTITVTVTVSYVPTSGAISGIDSVCVGNTVTLTESVTGGVWSDIIAGIATVGGSGVVTGAAAGIDTVVYTVTTACGSAAAKMPVKVLPLANAGVISGIDSVCPGKTITLSETVTGGVWSNVVSGVSTVSSSGVVAGTTPGVDTIVYSVTNSCGTAKAKRAVKVLSPSICQKLQLGVNGLAARDECSIYPNPSNGKFSVLISSPNPKEATANITDITGKKLKEFTIQTNSSTDLELDLQSGVYLLNITTDSNVQTRKIVITR